LRTRRALPFFLLAQFCLAQPNLDVVVEHARREFNVPGIAVAIVKEGKVVLAKGYGVRKLGEDAPVTPQTLFGIASNTKAFTAAALAMLVDEGKIRWDDPVIDHLPSFQMHDPYVTRELTVRDLLVHRSGLGLGAGDLMFWPQTDLTRNEVFRRIRFLKPASSFRSRYAYDNILYLVAGQIIPAVTGISWDDFVRDRIFGPAGMTLSNTSVRRNPSGGDVATPHAPEAGKPVPISPSVFDNNAPCGAINSCVADMAKWITIQLNAGSLGNGKRLFSAERSREMWSAQTVMPIGSPPPGSHPALRNLQPNFLAYGLGWVLSDYRGHKTVSHTGGLAGYVSRVMLVPDLRLGIVVLTNQEARGGYDSIIATVLDYYLQAPPSDWVSAFADLARRRETEAEGTIQKTASARSTSSRPSLSPGAYAGRYRDSWYGDMVIEERAGKLAIRFTHSPDLSGRLEHWQYDTFIARWAKRTLLADAYVTFSLKPDGSIDEVRMAPVSPLTDFSYDFQDLRFKPVALDAKPY
jgi:CubicO group peptidase (beta-lactamase class C family)